MCLSPLPPLPLSLLLSLLPSVRQQDQLFLYLLPLSLYCAHLCIYSGKIEGETVTDFIFLGSKITADGDYSHEIKRRLLLGRKDMTNLDRESRDITLPTKVHLVKAMVFPVVI